MDNCNGGFVPPHLNHWLYNLSESPKAAAQKFCMESQKYYLESKAYYHDKSL
ncbi:MAG: hypothetical protein ACYTXY_51375 [Nostoc sp.]